MNPGRGVNAVIASGYSGCIAARIDIDAYRYDRADSGLQRPFNGGRDGIGKFGEIQVSVCVNQFRKFLHIFVTFGY